MAIVNSRTFILDGQRPYITLAREEYMRPLSFGNNWTCLRLALLVAVQPSGTSNILNTGLFLGICSGSSAGVGAPSTTNFVGADISGNNDVVYTWTYNAGGGNPYFTATNPSTLSKVDTTYNISGVGSFTWAHPAAGLGLARKGLVLVHIIKGSPNFRVSISAISAALVVSDYTFSQMFEYLDAYNTPGLNDGYSYLNGVALSYSTGTPPCSEADGPLDTLDIYWPSTTHPLELYALAVNRMY